MQTCGGINDRILQVVLMIAEFRRKNGPVLETGQNMLDHNTRLCQGTIVRLLLVGKRGCRIGLGFARSLVRDVQFEGLEIIGKAEIAQIKPNLELGKPALFWGKLRFEKTIIMLTAPDRMTEKHNLPPQGAHDGIFYRILMLFAAIAFF